MDSSDNKDVLVLVQFANLCKKVINHPNEIKDWVDFSSKIRYFKECLKEKALAVIIIFHAYGGLPYFLTFLIYELQQKSGLIKQKFPNQNDRRNLLTILSSILNLIFNSSYHCFLQRQKLLAYDSSQPSQSSYSQKLQHENYSSLMKKAEKFINIDKEENESIFKELLDKMQEIQTQTGQKRIKLNQFILGKLLIEKTDHPFDQAALNWIKKTTQLIQHEKPELVCCRLVFKHKQISNLSKFSESANQQFKDYRWPLENQSIKFHLTKTVIGFLNTTGGIIYVGLRQDKDKIIEVKGIKLNAQQKIDFLFFIHDEIMKAVYPKQPDRKQHQQDLAKDPNKETQYRKKLKKEFECHEKKSEYRINKYVHIDFLDIYDKDTFLNSKDDFCGLYIARIKIKLGDCHELYHVINHEKNIPQAYYREDKSVKKKSFKDFYDIFYDRIKNSNSYGNEKTEQHGYCRFNPRCNE